MNRFFPLMLMLFPVGNLLRPFHVSRKVVSECMWRIWFFPTQLKRIFSRPWDQPGWFSINVTSKETSNGHGVHVSPETGKACCHCTAGVDARGWLGWVLIWPGWQLLYAWGMLSLHIVKDVLWMALPVSRPATFEDRSVIDLIPVIKVGVVQLHTQQHAKVQKSSGHRWPMRMGLSWSMYGCSYQRQNCSIAKAKQRGGAFMS